MDASAIKYDYDSLFAGLECYRQDQDKLSMELQADVDRLLTILICSINEYYKLRETYHLMNDRGDLCVYCFYKHEKSQCFRVRFFGKTFGVWYDPHNLSISSGGVNIVLDKGNYREYDSVDKFHKDLMQLFTKLLSQSPE